MMRFSFRNKNSMPDVSLTRETVLNLDTRRKRLSFSDLDLLHDLQKFTYSPDCILFVDNIHLQFSLLVVPAWHLCPDKKIPADSGGDFKNLDPYDGAGYTIT